MGKNLDQIVKLMVENKNDKAEKKLRQILAKDTQSYDAWHLLGVIQLKKGEIDEAIKLISKALSLFPQFPDAFANLSACYIEKKEYQRAIQTSEKALKIDPNCKGAMSNLLLAKYHLGKTDKRKTNEAIHFLINALKSFQNDDRLINHIGMLFSFKKDENSAIEYFKKSINNNNSFDGYFNLSCSLKNMGHYAEALEIVEKMRLLYPKLDVFLDSVEAVIFYEWGKIQDAVAAFEKVLKIFPDNADAQYSLGMLRLLLGDFTLGLKLHEGRNKNKDWFKGIDAPEWHGENIEGKTLLVCSEQGLGDLIQFLRYIPLLIPYNCKIIISLPVQVHCLFEPLGFPLVSGDMGIPKHDVYVFMPSLPYIFKTNLSNIPPPISIPNIQYHPIKNRVGISWRGNPEHKKDRQRSLDVKLLLPLLKTPNIQFVCLQKDVTPQEKRFLEEHGVRRFCLDTFTDTCHVLEKCDRVISVDTCIVHLSGSLEIPTWVLLPLAPDWRWLLDRKDSPWYHSLRLFRQTIVDCWNEPIEEVKNQLIAELL